MMEKRAAWLFEKLKNLPMIRKREGRDPITSYLLLTVLAASLIAVISFWIYNRTHLFDGYRVLSSAVENDVEGTQYRMLGSRIIKYSHDGVFCANTENEVEWSAAYSMQTPICDVCGSTMVIAEQQGTQVFVLNNKGVIGSFATALPIMKARVSSGGVVALVLKDGDVTWINLYTAEGEPVVSVKTTVQDSGYPLDIALAANARRMLVSYLGEEEGNLTGKIAFYDFSSAQASDESHLVDTISYPGVVFPEVYYGTSQTPVAIADDGYAVFRVGNRIEERTRVTFQSEIVSSFHDDKSIGFVFKSEQPDTKYRMEVYGYTGRMNMSAQFDFDYSGVRMESGEILLYDASDLYIYRSSGRQKLAVSYGKQVLYFTGVSGMRRYLVITDSSMDRIRIE